MGLLNQAMHEGDPSYGYGPSFEERQARQRAIDEWHAEWRATHLIKVAFGDLVVECSLFVEVMESSRLHRQHDPIYDVYSCHGDKEGRMLVKMNIRSIPEMFPDVSFNGDVGDIEGSLIWNEDQQIYVPDQKFMKNLKRRADYIRISNPINLNGEVFYFPIKNKRSERMGYPSNVAEAHVNGQIFPVRREIINAISTGPWKLCLR